MLVKKSQIPIVVTFLVVLFLYSMHFYSIRNVEFLIYVGVVIFFAALILFTNRTVKYPNSILWGLTIWAAMHMSGGGLYIGETRLYELILWPISEQYEILKYDQFVHAFGFAITTLLVFHILRPHLPKKIKSWTAISVVVVMAGLGFGALNEIVEFFAVVFSPSTGVGGYYNTALDLVFNLIGAIVAMLYIRLRTSDT